MTNKPMLSVERELLKDLADYGDKGKVAEPYMVEKLRALLDKPACAKCGNPTVCGKVVCEDCCYEMPVAQHQGEPVGEVVHVSEDQIRIGLYDEYSLKVGDLVYAEQPAPVAVVMPERKGANHKDWREWTHEEIGYNKALDDVDRLNGVKP